ncbi:MAG: T9SS type A sorting domain-containing protein [bacterium]|nr:T9SS type A sorting domain-containing protein [bacterium]
MRTLKISLLIFSMLATLFAQQDNIFHSEKTLLIPFLTQMNDDPAQKLRQELNMIINESRFKQSVRENYLIDSLISESVTGAKIKFFFEYNIDDKIVERTEFNNDLNGNWHLVGKDEYFYDTIGNLIREIYFDWNNTTWDSSLQILSEYNQDNNLISTTIQTYILSNWENEERITYTYDQAGRQITSLIELWENNQWINSGRDFSYYSTENRRDSLLFQIWEGNDWQNYWRTSFYYDSLTTFLNYAIAQLWTGIQFEDYLLLKIMNDEIGNQIQQLEQIWNGSVWVNDVKKDYTYIWNYFESCNAELWNGSIWEPGDTPIIINNPDGFKIAIICQSIHIYYTIVNVESTNSNIPNDFSLSQNYPNPFNPVTKIKYNIPNQSFVMIKIYDVLGNEIETLVNEEKPAGEYEVEFDGSSLSSGIYFYTLRVSDKFLSGKMILQK